MKSFIFSLMVTLCLGIGKFAQAEAIDLNQALIKYLMAIEHEAAKDGIILIYHFIDSNNSLELIIHSKDDIENRFEITYEFSESTEAKISIARFDQNIRYEKPAHTYDEFSQKASFGMYPEAKLLNFLDVTFESILNGVTQETINAHKKTDINPHRKRLYSMVAKTKNRYNASLFGFYALLASTSLYYVATLSVDAGSTLFYLAIWNSKIFIKQAKSYYTARRSFNDTLELTYQAQTWRKNSTITLRNNCASHFKKKL